MKNLQKFADRLHEKTGANFFVDITYNPGRRSRTVNLGEVFVARLRLQEFYPQGSVHNRNFRFKNLKDVRDEGGDVYGRGTTANAVLADLLRSIAGKALLVDVNGRTRTIRVPANIAD